jgi:hypothetical protein
MCAEARGSVVGRGTATSRNVVGSNLDEVDYFQFTYSASASNRNEYQEGKGRTARKADNLTAICEPIV